MNKKFWQSKVFWVNLLALIGLAVPGVSEFVAKQPETVGSIFAVVNIVLRLFKSNITIA